MTIGIDIEALLIAVMRVAVLALHVEARVDREAEADVRGDRAARPDMAGRKTTRSPQQTIRVSDGSS